MIRSIKENYIFRRAYRKGKAYVFPAMVIYVLKGARQTEPRLGITVTKKQGNAPTRNRIRRIIRAAFAAQADILPNRDIIVVARSRCATCKSTDLEGLIQQVFGEQL
ncbi:MAG: ribonuclease P protein component [Clostridia bacterium]|nr:ribonuclease P protein component [Clostridia bacterium]